MRLTLEAIGALSSYAPDRRIAQYLRRKMTDDDRGVALSAAIVSCYSGDASGGALVVRCRKSDDPALRLTAIAQVVDNDHFRPHRAAIVRALLPTTTAPLPPPPVETLEQADKRLQAAGEQASSSAKKPVNASANGTFRRPRSRVRQAAAQPVVQTEIGPGLTRRHVSA